MFSPAVETLFLPYLQSVHSNCTVATATVHDLQGVLVLHDPPTLHDSQLYNVYT